LRLIITAGSIGITSFIVIHLIIHAFFKAILFVAIGDLIHRRRSYQSFQKTGQLVFRSHLRATGTFVASLGLIGAPFIAAFYSKEPILENTIILGIPISSVLSVTIRLAITSYYRIRLIVLTLTN
jgi:NADH-quinone oxidoreductase subunit L